MYFNAGKIEVIVVSGFNIGAPIMSANFLTGKIDLHVPTYGTDEQI